MLWLVHRNRRNSGRVQILLSGYPAERVAHRERVTRGAGAARRARVWEREGAVNHTYGERVW
jgi:hypothetical protein